MKRLLLAGAFSLACCLAMPVEAQQINYGAGDGINFVPVTAATPLPVTCPSCSGVAAPNYPASGVSPVTFNFTTSTTAGTCSSPFTPAAGRNFNFVARGPTIAPGAALGASLYLVREVDGSTFLPLTANGTQLETFSTVVSEQWNEAQYGVQYEACTVGIPANTISGGFYQ